MGNWRTVAPIWLEYPDVNRCLQSRFSFGENVFVGPASEWALDEADILGLSEDHRMCVRGARFAFAAEYVGSQREPDPDFPGRSKQEAANLRIQIANIAVWLARPTAIGFQTVLHQEVRGSRYWNDVSQPGPWWRVYPHPGYASESLSSGDLDLAKRLYAGIRDLERNGSIWVAVFMLFKGISDNEWVIRFPLLWIAAEAIFGADDGREIRHQLAERVALFLAVGDEAREVYRRTKRDYDLRSKAIHGMRVIGLSDSETESALLRTEELIRVALNKILLDPELRRTLNSEGRDSYLSELAFGQRNEGEGR